MHGVRARCASGWAGHPSAPSANGPPRTVLLFVFILMRYGRTGHTEKLGALATVAGPSLLVSSLLSCITHWNTRAGRAGEKEQSRLLSSPRTP